MATEQQERDELAELRAFAEEEMQDIHMLPPVLQPHTRGMQMMKIIERAQVALDARLAQAKVEALRPLRELFAGGPDTPCRTTWRDEPGVLGIECVEVPMTDLRRAFDEAEGEAAR